MSKILQLLFLFQIVLFGCNCNSKSKLKNSSFEEKKQTSETVFLNQEKINFDVFIENSESTNGYIKQGTSSFKTSLYKILGSLKPSFSDSIRLNFVTKNVCKQKPNATPKQILDFIRDLKPSDLNVSECPIGTTDIPNVIQNSIKNLTTKGVSIIISDCIFSSGKYPNDLPQDEESMRVILRPFLSKLNLGVSIIKLDSQFDGDYFIETNHGKRTPFKGIRPFYVLIFGTDENLITTLKNIDIKNLDGYKNSIIFLNDYSETFKGKITTKLIKDSAIGSYKIEAPANSMNIVDFKYSSETPTQFSIAVNFSKINFPKEYFMEKSNYFISDDYTIKDIDYYNKDGYTNKILIRTSKVITNKDSIIIGLKKYNLPFWVDSTNTNDDNISNKNFENQTYGIKYLLSGISQAFKDMPNYSQNEYTKITKVKFYTESNSKNGGSNTLIFGIIIFLALLIISIIFLKNKSK